MILIISIMYLCIIENQNKLIKEYDFIIYLFFQNSVFKKTFQLFVTQKL